MKITGIAASPGIAIGQVSVMRDVVQQYRRTVEPGEVPSEKARYRKACRAASAELEVLKGQAAERFGAEKAEVFTAQQMMLDDPSLVEAVLAAIDGLSSAEAAVEKAIAETAAMLASLDDPYLRERAADVQDIGRRLIRLLAGNARAGDLSGIVAAKDLLPSDTAELDLNIVKGFITALGGKTSHSSILARSAGIPAVVGIGNKTFDELKEGSTVILDGQAGTVIVDPSPEELSVYKLRQEQEEAQAKELAAMAAMEGRTADGLRVEVAANIGRPGDIDKILAVGAEGVGLFRTEFLFLDRTTVPTEEEQVEAYSAVLKAMPERKVIIRTLDAGGDKQLPFLDQLTEANPALGFRAIRLCLVYRDIFMTQLRALLRAGVHGNLHVMFPMIATPEELAEAKALLREAAAALAREGIEHNDKVPVGIMVEIPAAAMIADILLSEVDFFSIGTNDLVQYTMAADRMNEHVAKLGDYYQPAVIRMIARVAEVAKSGGKWTGMCGEMAGDPLATPLLIGLGLTELSMNARSVLQVKQRTRQLTLDQAKHCANAVLKLATAEEVRRYLEKFVEESAG